MSELNFDKFILFGDSITEFSYNPEPRGYQAEYGFGGAMQNAYTRRLDIVQRGFSGYNSEHARILLPKILSIESKNKIQLMTVFFGTNDAALGGPQKVDLPRYVENMQFIINIILEHGIKPIVIGPGFHNAEVWNPKKPEDVAKGIIRSTENNKLYSDALSKVLQQLNVPFVDMYEQFEKYNEENGNFDDLLTDGIHYSGNAYKIMFNEVMGRIRESYPEFHPDNLKMKLPEWEVLTNEALEAL